MYSTANAYAPSIGDLFAMSLPGLLVLVMGLLVMIAWCRMFSKAGLPWERMFVPAYGSYTQYRIAEVSWMFWVNLILGVVMFFANPLNSRRPSGFAVAFAVIVVLAKIVLHCIFSVKLSRAYGRGIGFAIGLMLLYPIFIMILGFGGSEYGDSYSSYQQTYQESNSGTSQTNDYGY